MKLSAIRALALLFPLLLSAPTLAAQDTIPRVRRPDTVYPGATVRLTTPDAPGFRLQGMLTRADADSVSVAKDNVVTTVPRASVQRVDAYQGRSLGTGALRGAGVGAVGGLVLGLAGALIVLGTDGDDSPDGDLGGLAIAIGMPLGGAMTGVIFGTPIGMVMAPKRWAPRRLPGAAEGTAVGITLRVP